jgi:hypothetical protein
MSDMCNLLLNIPFIKNADFMTLVQFRTFGNAIGLGSEPCIIFPPAQVDLPMDFEKWAEELRSANGSPEHGDIGFTLEVEDHSNDHEFFVEVEDTSNDRGFILDEENVNLGVDLSLPRVSDDLTQDVLPDIPRGEIRTDEGVQEGQDKIEVEQPIWRDTMEKPKLEQPIWRDGDQKGEITPL